MFSVIIPLYNKESQIKKTLESVLNQTFKDFEIVIVNDGSIDKSIEVVESFDDNRIRIINQNNSGVSQARNRGIIEANRKWIAFLDADDLWKPNKLEKYSKIINDNIDLEWLLSGYTSLKGEKKNNFTYNFEGKFIDAIDALNDGLSIQTSTVVVKKQTFLDDENLFFTKGINNSEDREVWYKLIFKFPSPYYIKDDLTNYMIDETGKSLNTSNKVNFSFMNLENRLSYSLNKVNIERKEKFIIFLNKYNHNGLWKKWVFYGWRNEFEEYIFGWELNIMKTLGKLPIFFRKLSYMLLMKIL